VSACGIKNHAAFGVAPIPIASEAMKDPKGPLATRDTRQLEDCPIGPANLRRTVDIASGVEDNSGRRSTTIVAAREPMEDVIRPFAASVRC
jgi:hypothetical protein